MGDVIVTDTNIPPASNDQILVVLPYNATPTPNSRLKPDTYYSFKNSWRKLFTPIYELLKAYVPITRTLTINGTEYDLSANRSWTVAAGSPAGADTQVQFNDGGAFGADSTLTFNKTTKELTVQDAILTSGTASQIVQLNGSKKLVTSNTLPNGTIATTQTAGDNSMKVATTAYVDGFMPMDSDIKAYQAMGSVIKAQKVGLSLNHINSGGALADQQVLWNAVYLNKPETLTGAIWYQVTQGSYTANNYNGVGLCSYSGGTLTLVASSTNDGNIWKATANTYSTKAFSSTYAAAAGLYFVVFLYCRSAQVTAPTVGIRGAVANAAVWSLDFTNSIKPYLFMNGQTALPATQAASGTGGAGSSDIWVGVY